MQSPRGLDRYAVRKDRKRSPARGIYTGIRWIDVSSTTLRSVAAVLV